MLSLETRVLAVVTSAWRRLPASKKNINVRAICVEDLGAQHGQWSPSMGILTLNTRLFWGDTPDHLMLIDADGSTPPQQALYCSRALHTATHELMHALGTSTGLDQTPEWLHLSGWVEAADDPQGTARYVERRPGWPQERTPWRHRLGCWFCRDYSRRTPFEDFADAGTHVALGWTAPFLGHPNGRAKLAYLRQRVWEEHGVRAYRASAARWRAAWQPALLAGA